MSNSTAAAWETTGKSSSERSQSDVLTFFGVLSFIATFALVVILACRFSRIAPFRDDLINLLTLHVEKISVGTDGLEGVLRIIAISAPCSIVAGFFGMFTAWVISGKFGSHKESFKFDVEHEFFKKFFILMIAEELLARGLFLGVFTKISFLSGTTGFYLLFLIGNGFWALIHLSNFKDKDEHPLHTLPQFLSGIVFTVVFVKYGFLASVLTHTAHNAILFATCRCQRISAIDFVIMVFDGVVAWLAWSQFTKPLSDVRVLLRPGTSLVITGWTFWDYAWLAIFASFFLDFTADVLLYDRSGLQSVQTVKKEDKKKPTLLERAIGFVIIAMIGVGVFYFQMWLVGYIFNDLGLQALVTSLWTCFAAKSRSPSALSRVYFASMPSGFICIAAMYALGFWSAVGLILILILFSIPEHQLMKLDD